MRLLALAFRRILWMPPTLFGLLLIVFAISHVIPADPAQGGGRRECDGRTGRGTAPQVRA